MKVSTQHLILNLLLFCKPFLLQLLLLRRQLTIPVQVRQEGRIHRRVLGNLFPTAERRILLPTIFKAVTNKRKQQRQSDREASGPPFIALIIEIVFERQRDCNLLPLFLALVLLLLALLLLTLLQLKLVRQAALIRLFINYRPRFPFKKKYICILFKRYLGICPSQNDWRQ